MSNKNDKHIPTRFPGNEVIFQDCRKYFRCKVCGLVWHHKGRAHGKISSKLRFLLTHLKMHEYGRKHFSALQQALTYVFSPFLQTSVNEACKSFLSENMSCLVVKLETCWKYDQICSLNTFPGVSFQKMERFACLFSVYSLRSAESYSFNFPHSHFLMFSHKRQKPDFSDPPVCNKKIDVWYLTSELV